MTANDAIAATLSGAKTMLNRFAEDLKPAEYLHRPAPQANCAAWIIGHLVMSTRSQLKALGTAAAELPALPEGFDKRFARDETAPRSADYGDTSVLMPLFNQHWDLMIAAARSMPAERLDQPLEKPHALFQTLGGLAAFAGLHVVMHAGQITYVRRSLGRPPII